MDSGAAPVLVVVGLLWLRDMKDGFAVSFTPCSVETTAADVDVDVDASMPSLSVVVAVAVAAAAAAAAAAVSFFFCISNRAASRRFLFCSASSSPTGVEESVTPGAGGVANGGGGGTRDDAAKAGASRDGFWCSRPRSLLPRSSVVVAWR